MANHPDQSSTAQTPGSEPQSNHARATNQAASTAPCAADLEETTTQAPQTTKAPLGIIGMIGSVLAAVFGIQSQKNRERDFKAGNPSDFIVLGVIFVIILIVSMIALVNSVLPD